MATSHSPTLESRLSAIGVETGRPTPTGTVDRRYAPFLKTDSEPFETLRDALRRETRLRLRPPDPWRLETDETFERAWLDERTGHVVRLTTDGVLDDWTLTVDGEVELAGTSRLAAFERTAERMGEIAGRAPEV